MKFYDCETAPSPRRVRLFIAEKGIDIETVQVDLASREQFSENFQKINPDCVVPALELDDGSVITEVVAICDYLESKYPEPPLFGTSAEERARVLMWNAKIEQQGLSAAADAFRNSSEHFKDRAMTGRVSIAQIPELAQRGRDRIGHFYDRLDGQLADNKYVAGDRLSIADITARVSVDFAIRLKIPIPEQATNVQRWHGVVSGR